ncbi:Sec-independent protein translocase subunit TatA [Kineosporia rhizophila]|uniref:Sec-independent protein translocase subunit TatA n=1 Tax=Kineosporia TaxID=49184 RepID=UPI001E62B94D|nr:MULTISPECIES: Sec-independent protein translocase subunit TatA [Kineosporia]MCE0538420.1 Sec-independent protein translocase subunit TatA [Kineosporia rhizophila]GLY18272.1 Sec-independent protein translocase protein TatA [Kineosporia sp. NBRC 101677]
MGFLKEPSHIIIMILVLVILFGSRRLPDAARGIGRSMRIFKSEIKQMKDDDNDDEAARRKAQADELRRQADALQAGETPMEGRVMSPQQQREEPGYQARHDA